MDCPRGFGLPPPGNIDAEAEVLLGFYWGSAVVCSGWRKLRVIFGHCSREAPLCFDHTPPRVDLRVIPSPAVRTLAVASTHRDDRDRPTPSTTCRLSVRTTGRSMSDPHGSRSLGGCGRKTIVQRQAARGHETRAGIAGLRSRVQIPASRPNNHSPDHHPAG
jgi:hypothetical protein